MNRSSKRLRFPVGVSRRGDGFGGEDEILIRGLIVEELLSEGFFVLEASNADEAIPILEARNIRLVFTDIDMPGSMDGLKLAAFVRDRWPPVEIIVTSGKT